jgi:lipopolysaccharide export system protein LptC
MTAHLPHVTPPARDADRSTMWQPRQVSAASSVAQYSRFVSAMKVALPAAAGILLLLVIILPQLRQDDDRFRIGTSLLKGETTDTLSMTNARYFGTDDKGQPYTVTAEGVRQRTENESAIDLVSPKAEVTMNSGTLLSAAATTGLYDRDKQQLDLSGEVSLLQDKGNQLHTSAAQVLLKDGTASGTAPVRGEGSFGTMEAQGGFDMTDRGRIVHFKGPARLVLNADARAKSNKDSAAPSAPATPSAAPALAPGIKK